MYLSRIALDIAKRDTMLALQNPAMLHGAVERAFEPRTQRALWRLDRFAGQQYLLLLSPEQPNCTDLIRQFGTGAPAETRDYAPLLDRITPGSVWQFRLHANPTYSTFDPQERGKVYACLLMRKTREPAPGQPEPKTQVGWLMKQGEQHGFTVEEQEISILRNQWYTFWKKTGGRVRLLGVTYEGRLTVTDADKFREALMAGIGRGKAYGMGLLTVMHP